MENLTPKQEKHKQKIELLSILIDEKAITLTDALLLLSDTEERVTQPIPSGPIPRTPLTGPTGPQGPIGVPGKGNWSPYQAYDIRYGSGTTFVGFNNTTGQLVNMDTTLTTTGSSNIRTELANEYLNDLDSQE
jgi:hypothetical protein